MKKLLALCVLCSPGLAGAVDIYNLNGSQGWFPNDVRSGGTLGITTAQPRSGNGSLEIMTDSSIAGSGQAKSYATFATGSALGTLGNLAAGSISMDFFKSSLSTVGAIQDLVFQIHWRNASGATGNLTWENAYNGNASVATDVWRTLDITSGNYWIRSSPSTGGGAVNWDGFGQWKSLTDWSNNGQAVFPGSSSQVLTAQTEIMGFSIGFGSGLEGKLLAFADNVNVSFAQGNTFSSNFEAVPEPFTMSLGAAGIALAIRKRRKK